MYLAELTRNAFQSGISASKVIVESRRQVHLLPQDSEGAYDGLSGLRFANL